MILSSKVGVGRRAPRRLRRGALPSSLIGLVTFSFTVLAFSTVAYTTSLPALIQAAQRADDDSLFYKAIAGLVQADAQLGGADAASDAKGEGASHAGDRANGGAPSGAPSRGPVTLGGASLQGIITNIAGSAAPKPEAPAPGSGTAPEGVGGGGNAGGQQGGNGGSTGGGSTGGNGGGSGSGGGTETQPPVPSPEAEEKTYNHLLQSARGLDAFVSRVNQATSAFNNDCLASQGVRTSHRADCMVLKNDLLVAFDAVLNKTPIEGGSKYYPAMGNLIRMHRLLWEYSIMLCEAWDINVPMPDPSVNIDAFMAPIRQCEQNGVNVMLAEFRQCYEGFVL